MTSGSRHHLFLNAISELKAVPAGASSPALASLVAAQSDFADDIDVLNYALTLEHLEAAFYQMAGDYTFGSDAFGNSIDEWLAAVGGHETAHVETLTQVITQLGGEPVAAAQYDFGVTDAQSYLMTAATLENVGVAAYDGAGAAIQNPDLLTAAGSIVAVEARHAAYLNLLIGETPFPAAFEKPMTKAEVLDAAGGFIVQ
ncbi:MAG TPA: ferritin-like domain-containing protein [Thermomicrobiales bacterium]|jgi:hypothetical protein|nr:ferritin-like domain-containing protein [Thermomicrobiales bacterium]